MPLNQNDVDRSIGAIKYLQAYRTDEERARKADEQRQIENQRADRSETRANTELDFRRQGMADANTRAEQARKDANDRFNATREDTKAYRNEQLAAQKEKAKAQADYYSAQLQSKDAATRIKAEQEILKGAQDLVNKLEEGVKAGTYDPNVANNLVKMGYEMASPEQKAILDRDPRYKAAVGGVPLFKGPEKKKETGTRETINVEVANRLREQAQKLRDEGDEEGAKKLESDAELIRSSIGRQPAKDVEVKQTPFGDEVSRRMTADEYERTKGSRPAPGAPQTVPPVEQRKAGQVYNTPRGPMKWVGNGWEPVK